MTELEKVERKYGRKIKMLIKKMKDNTMSELWIELDKLKKEMAEELKGLL